MLEKMKDQNGIFNWLIANHLIEKDKLTKKIYEILKEESSYFENEEKELIYSPLDWYVECIKKPQNDTELIEEFEETLSINDDILDKKLSKLNIKDKFNR